MDFPILASVAEELNSLLAGSRAEQVSEDGEMNIFILCRDRKRKEVLFISPDRSLPRIHLVAQKPAPSQRLHTFTQFLKSRVRGARIVCIGLLNEDRIVEIKFSSRGSEYVLVFELINAAPNLVILDGSGVILSVYRPLPGDDRHRPLMPGIVYQPPERKKFFPDQTKRQAERAVPTPDSANRAVAAYYEQFLSRRHFQTKQAGIEALLKKQLSRAERRLRAISADLAEAEDAERYKQAGDLILMNLGVLRKGLTEAVLTGYDGVSQTIALDPERTAAGNAEQYFKKYKKARAGHAIIAVRHRQTGGEIHFLKSRLRELETAVHEADLLRIQSTLKEKGFIPPVQRKGEADKNAETGRVRRFSYKGWEIVVGRNAAGNDFISTRLARADDIWLHAEGLPGSHVLIRNSEKKGIPQEVLLKAAGVAAYYSRGRASGKIPVTYTAARYVRKPKGAKPGLVTLIRNKTVMAVPDKGATGESENGKKAL